MYIPTRFRPILRRVVPDRLRRWRGDRWRQQLERATDRLWEVSEGEVLTGPFAGMRYLRTNHSQLGPKLLGTYEQELQPVLRPLTQTPAGTVLNVGSGEGYHACGLLRIFPHLHVVAYDLSEKARALLGELARRNDVASRLEIRGRCTSEELQRSLLEHPSASIFMDVEGVEVELLDPERVPQLLGSSILVETHDFAVPGGSAELEARFLPTHRIHRIPAVDPYLRGLPEIEGLTRNEVLLCAFERSAEDQHWLWMRPR